MKGHGKSRRAQTHNKKAREINFVEVFGIEEEIGYSQIFSEAARDHRKQYDPAKQQHVIALYVVQQ